MFIFLSKILPPLIYPVGLCFLLLVISLFFFKKLFWHKIFVITAICILFLAGNQWIAYSLVRSLEWRYIPKEDIPQADVIVVLGGATNSASYPRQLVEISGAGDRIFYAYHLFEQGKAPNILLSGGGIDWYNPNSHPAEDMAKILTMMRVPQDILWLEKSSRNTYENAIECKKIIAAHKVNTIILVTSAIHMPRSVALFEKQGLDVTPAPVDYTVTAAEWDELMKPSLLTILTNIIPSSDNINLVTKALKEYIGIWIYSLRGWL